MKRSFKFCLFSNAMLTFGSVFGEVFMSQQIVSATPLQTSISQTAFRLGAREVMLPFELTNNHIYVQVRINDSPPVWFIFDTGAAASMVDLELARSLGLQMQGQIQGMGAGANRPTGSFLKGVRLSLPGEDGYQQALQIAFPFSALSLYEGRALSGVLGYEFICQFVIEIDYAAQCMRLRDPQDYHDNSGGSVVPLTFKTNHPHVRARLELAGRAPIEGDFVVDTGSRLPLALTRPFVETHRLLQHTARTISAPVAGAGVGGESRALIGRWPEFRLGGFVLKNPIVGFSQDQEGAFATTQFFEGNIGGAILRRFKVILDYSRNRMILEPAAGFSEAFETDMSGVVWVAEGADFKTFTAHQVAENSPAVEAGLRKGDVLVSLNGRSAREYSLEQLRQMLRQHGKELTLTLQRDQQPITMKLKLRRLI